ncbi:MAG TPA: hypothetical protein PKD65_19555 [Nitrospira sp.]|nr:hypothetical protein [Nitrospira sp.]
MNENLNPFAMTAAPAQSGGGALARGNEQRAVAEVQAAVLMAKRFPRDQIAAMDRILNSFTRPSLAEVSQYQYSKGGTDVSGPSIRSAEAIAQQWGNIDFGFRELSRGVGHDGVPFSEVEAYAWDMETLTRKPLQFIVRHWRDTKKGGYKITDERDIYELVANQAQRRVRACLLSIIPGDVTEAAMKQADLTLKSTADIGPEAQAKMVEAFSGYGVTKEQIEKRIQRRLDTIQPAQMVSLKKIYVSLRDGMSTAADWFDGDAGGEQHAQETRARPVYTAEDFAKAMPGWKAAVQSGKKTTAQIITMAKTRADLTSDQEAAINALVKKPEEKKSESMSFAQVSEALHQAGDLDTLDAKADLIRQVADEGQRTELNTLYHDLRVKLEK